MTAHISTQKFANNREYKHWLGPARLRLPKLFANTTRLGSRERNRMSMIDRTWLTLRDHLRADYLWSSIATCNILGLRSQTSSALTWKFIITLYYKNGLLQRLALSSYCKNIWHSTLRWSWKPFKLIAIHHGIVLLNYTDMDRDFSIPANMELNIELWILAQKANFKEWNTSRTSGMTGRLMESWVLTQISIVKTYTPSVVLTSVWKFWPYFDVD